jgi:hypothetical protein
VIAGAEMLHGGKNRGNIVLLLLLLYTPGRSCQLSRMNAHGQIGNVGFRGKYVISLHDYAWTSEAKDEARR